MMEKLLNKKSFEFNWNNHFHNTKISFEIPELNKDKCQVGGDWGPNYKFELNPHNPIVIKYFNNETKNEEQIKLESRFLEVNSPMLAEVRNHYPLYYVIEHKDRGVRYEMYIDQEANLQRVDIINLGDNSCLYTSELKEAC